MPSEIVEVVNTLPAVHERSSVLLMPVMDVNTALTRLEEFQVFCANYLQESKDGGLDGGDYGVIPGAGKKKVLLKSGADKLCEVYGLYDEYLVISSVEDWEKGLFDYTLKCVLKSRRDDSMVGSGVGSCSSFEAKYRWREKKRQCPACGKETIIKGRDFSGQNLPAGWVCWKKDGKSDGCGAKFKDGDKQIEDQIQGRIENPDIIDSKNTVLKMAKKRAKIDATIGVTRSSGIFTQDLDELPAPPPTKTVERTTEDIEIKKSAPDMGSRANAVSTLQEVKAQGADTHSTAEADKAGSSASVERSGTSPASAAVEYITAGQAANLHKEFRASIKKHNAGEYLRADQHFYQFLAKNGFVNGQQEPSAGAVPANRWFPVKEAALVYAQTCK